MDAQGRSPGVVPGKGAGPAASLDTAETGPGVIPGNEDIMTGVKIIATRDRQEIDQGTRRDDVTAPKIGTVDTVRKINIDTVTGEPRGAQPIPVEGTPTERQPIQPGLGRETARAERPLPRRKQAAEVIFQPFLV